MTDKIIEEENNISIETLDGTSGVSIETLNQRSGVSIETLNQKSGVSIETLNQRSGVSIETLNQRSGVSIETLNQRSGVSIETLNQRSGVSIETLHLVTVATHSERYLPILEQQIKDKNMKLNKLAMGKKYVGHFMKDLEMLDYLKKPEINDNDIIVFVDGFDTLCLSDEKEIIKKFKNLNCQMLLSIENVGSLSFIHSAVFQKVKGKFINTGLYMGYAKFMREFLEEMYKNDFDNNSNQKTWANFLERKNNYDHIKLDIDSEIFFNYSFTTTDKYKIEDRRIKIKPIDKKNELKIIEPCFIQGNGCEDLSGIIKATGHSKNNVHNDKRTIKVIENNLKAIFYIYPIIALYILLLVFSFLIVCLFLNKIYKIYKDKHYYIYI